MWCVGAPCAPSPAGDEPGGFVLVAVTWMNKARAAGSCPACVQGRAEGQLHTHAAGCRSCLQEQRRHWLAGHLLPGEALLCQHCPNASAKVRLRRKQGWQLLCLLSQSLLACALSKVTYLRHPGDCHVREREAWGSGAAAGDGHSGCPPAAGCVWALQR